ncbi:MAG TPA: conjugal transfer protein TraF [Planctomycetota bacterium]|nr:conjugal transfer protein TraF [Planctomycetota bacterium]
MKNLLVAGVWLLGVAPAAHAQDWFNIDAPTRGMGNAGVALADGPLATYWNPAALALAQKEGEFSLDAGGFALAGNAFFDVNIEGEILEQVDELYDLFNGADFATIQANLNLGTATPAELQTALSLLAQLTDLQQQGLGVIVQGGGTIEGRYGPIGFFTRYLGHAALDVRFGLGAGFASSLSDGSGVINGLTEALAGVPAGVPVGPNATALSAALFAAGVPAGQADTLARQSELALTDAGLTPAVQSAIIASALASIATMGDPGAVLELNESGVRVSGIIFKEAGVCLAYPLTPVFRVGVSLKEVIGETFELNIPLNGLNQTETMVDDIWDQIDQNRKRTNRFDMDAGISYSPTPTLVLGLSGRNLLGNEYDFESGAVFETKAQIRAGASIDLGIVRVAADMDLSKSETNSLTGFESRMAGAGIEFKPGVPGAGFSLKAGILQNLASDESDPTYSLSLGGKIAGFVIDVNGQLSSKKVDIEAASALNGTDSVSIPQRIAFALTIGLDLSW